jgi:hypothetical protein
MVLRTLVCLRSLIICDPVNFKFNTLNVSVEIVHNRPAFFAHRLEVAMKGLGTNDSALIRIIVDRSEIDLVNIKSEYERIYCKTLLSSVQVNESLYYFCTLDAQSF